MVSAPNALSKKSLLNLTSQLRLANWNETNVGDLLKQYSACKEAKASEVLGFFDVALDACEASDLRKIVDFARNLTITTDLTFEQSKPFIEKLLAEKENEDFEKNSVLLDFCNFFWLSSSGSEKEKFFKAFGDMDFLVKEVSKKLKRIGEYTKFFAPVNAFVSKAEGLWCVDEFVYLSITESDMRGVAQILGQEDEKDEQVSDVMKKLCELEDHGVKISFRWKLLNSFATELKKRRRPEIDLIAILEGSLQEICNLVNDGAALEDHNEFCLSIEDIEVQMNLGFKKDEHFSCEDGKETFGLGRSGMVVACLSNGNESKRTIGEKLLLLQGQGIKISFSNSELEELATSLMNDAARKYEGQSPNSSFSATGDKTNKISLERWRDGNEIWV